jgi:hypothetical protein
LLSDVFVVVHQCAFYSGIRNDHGHGCDWMQLDGHKQCGLDHDYERFYWQRQRDG